MSSDWIKKTKKNAAARDISFRDSLEDKNHRIAYHAGKCDTNKMYRGPSLLPLNHPAMYPGLPLPSPGTALTKEYLTEKRKSEDTRGDTTIRIMKNLRKK